MKNLTINVGDYVRTDKGTIDKLTKENIMTYEVALMGFGEKPIKSSPNIIDLIEVRDYVNGYKVISLWKDKTKVIGVAVDGSVIGFDECEIKSIVTKEQFESMEYKIER